MLFMVIEHFKNRDAKAVYLRAQEQSRMLPEGLTYVGSWVEDNFDRCCRSDGVRGPATFSAVDGSLGRPRCV